MYTQCLLPCRYNFSQLTLTISCVKKNLRLYNRLILVNAIRPADIYLVNNESVNIKLI